MRPLLLDLFCGAGGAAMGYHRAGFEVVGVDIKPQPRYPFLIWQGDAIQCMKYLHEGQYVTFAKDDDQRTYRLGDFAAIHASPPCQRYSRMRTLPWLKDNEYWDSIPPTRKALEGCDLWVIENVCGAPLCGIHLTGAMFGMDATKQRVFESNALLLAPDRVWPTTATKGGRMFGSRHHDGCAKIGIDWMNREERSQAIPPAYTEFIGRQLLESMECVA